MLRDILGSCPPEPQLLAVSDRELNNYRHARRRAAGISGPEMKRRRQQAKDDFAEWQHSVWDQVDKEKAEAAYRAIECQGESKMNKIARDKARDMEMRYITSRE